MHMPPVPTYTHTPSPNGNSIANAAAVISNSIIYQADAGLPNINAHTVRECATCNNRSYQDGGEVTTQNHPNQVALAVMSHVREQQDREARFAAADGRGGRGIIFNEISSSTVACEECGRVYADEEPRTITHETKQATAMSMLHVFATRKH
ncbi:MAG: hypothetical protein FWC89_09790 [Defluviitaleaceae bacterium]|nr:hypothetical protein [Defluviitaleaceae bacterium]